MKERVAYAQADQGKKRSKYKIRQVEGEPEFSITYHIFWDIVYALFLDVVVIVYYTRASDGH